MHADDVERVVVAEAELHDTARKHSAPAMSRCRAAAMRPTKPAHGVIATRPGDRTRRRAQRRGVPAADPLEREPAEHRGRGRQVRVDERLGGDAVRGERGPGVEAEPAEPQDAGADQRQRQRVRRHRVLRPAASPAEHEDRGQRGDAGVDVHDGAAGEVERAPLEEPAVGREHPVRDRRVHEHRPQPDEQTQAENRMRSAIAPVISAGVITANIIWYAMNDSGGIGTAPKPGRRSCGAVEEREVEVADVLAGAAEGERVHAHGPQHADEPEAKKFCISMPSTFLARTMPP